LRHSGQDAPAFLSALGFGEQQLEQSLFFVPLPRVMNAARIGRSWRPATAMRLGQTLAAPALGLVGSLLVHCATLRIALEQLQTCLPLLMSGGTLSVHEDGELARVALNLPWMEDRELSFVADLAAAALLRSVRALEPCDSDSAVLLPYAEPMNAEHRAVLDCPVHFSATRTEVVFAAEILDLRLPHADPDAFQALEACARGLLCSHALGERLQQKIERLLMADPSLYGAGEGALADRLGLTPRTLRRRLSEEGSTSSQIIDSARRARACRLLAETTVSIKDITRELRYSETSAFHRCFKRWTGMTPSQYRRSRRRQASRDSQPLGPPRRFNNDVLVARHAIADVRRSETPILSERPADSTVNRYATP
jgi:AraC-like DNA-binding protein